MSLSADDMKLYTENPKDASRKPLESMNLVKLQYTKLMHRNFYYSYTLTIKDRKDLKKKKTTTFTTATKQIKYLGINRLKEVKDLYSENY